MLLKKYISCGLIMLLTISVFAQETKKDINSLTRKDVLEMTIEELSDYNLEEMMKIMDIVGASSIEELYELLLNKDVTSASKSEESLFDSPLSTTVLSHEEITSSGATSIEEALRMVPGVIVREKTNGNYDVQIRGGQNMPMNNMLLYAENTTTLVMINGRPVFNYAMGGILWETLPVSLGEIDRIEVVRGPSSALYGPNAVNGVINLITKDIDSETPMVSANIQGGSQSTYIGDISLRKAFNDKVSAGLSYSFEHRERNTDKIYALKMDEFVDLETYQQNLENENWSSDNIFDFFDDPRLAKEKMGVNAYFNLQVNDKMKFNLSGGYIDAKANTSTIGDNPTPYNIRYGYSFYTNLNAEIYGFNIQANANIGTQDYCMGRNGWKHEAEHYTASIDYLLNLNKLSVRPGLSYQTVYQDDRKYTEGENQGYFNDKVNLENYAASLRFDYKPVNQIRLVAALRAEKYNIPDKWMPSYQFSASYKINENNLLRAVYSRANQSTFLLNAYSDYTWDRSEFSSSPSYVYFGSNEDPDMMIMDMFELGFRTRPSKRLLIDVEAFYNKSKDYSALMPDSMVTNVYNESYAIDPTSTLYTSYQTLDIEGTQLGISVSADVILSEKLIMKAHATFQKTTVDNFMDYSRDQIATLQGAEITSSITDAITNYYTTGTPPNAKYSSDTQPSSEEYKDDYDNEAIPSFWGSLSLSYKPIEKLEITAQSYYYGDYNIYTQYDNDADRVALSSLQYTGEMDGKFTLNAKVNYQLSDHINVYLNGRNILDNDKQEYIYMDKIGGIYLAGFNINF